MAAKVRIVIVDDHRLFRDGLRAIFAAYDDLVIVGEAADVREAELLVASVAHDLVIVDVTLGGRNGVAFIRELKRNKNETPVLVLSMHQHPDIVADAFAAGAGGYAVKHQSESELIEAIRTVVAGQRYLAPQIPAEALTAVSRGGNGKGLLAQLSSREREIFDLIVRGSSNASVAQQLFISVKTVETHRTRIMRKLGVHSVGELIRLAARHGLLAA
ncbi:MAG TPA: response regulator transcription factor [Polyangia bacterium]|jgi:DNA-binding NarL/FixJ family response regulator|nr:response regulator transcription factor [Polyangia bacterium]